MMREIELKLAVHGSFVVPPLISDDLGVASVEELPEVDMRTTYYDAADLRLARQGITLRYRTGEEPRARWTLKLPVPGKDGTTHDEFHYTGPTGRLPDEARKLATAFVRSASLVPVASIRTRRNRWLLRNTEASELAEVVDDEVSVYESRRVVARFREVEIETRGMDREGLQGIASLLEQAGARAAEPIPKVVRALGAKATSAPDVPADFHADPEGPAALAFQGALARGISRLMVHDPVTRLGADTEGVHQMRVATRRLRSDLRTFAPLIDKEWAEPLIADLKWLGSVLGAVRDLDVLQERLGRVADDLADDVEPLWSELANRHATARAELMSELGSERYVAMLDRLVDAVNNPSFSPLAKKSCEDQLPPLVSKPWRRLRKAASKLSHDTSDESYHKVRIRAKRARYAAEAVAPALPEGAGKAATRFAKRCSDIQDLLGELQDAAVGRQTVGRVAASHPESGPLNLALGRMIEREIARTGSAKKDFRDVWSSLNKNKNLKWLSA